MRKTLLAAAAIAALASASAMAQTTTTDNPANGTAAGADKMHSSTTPGAMGANRGVGRTSRRKTAARSGRRRAERFPNAAQAGRPGALPGSSLAVLKLMGPGEYVLQRPGDDPQGHFGLAAHDYTHSTAPNRRFAVSPCRRFASVPPLNSHSPSS